MMISQVVSFHKLKLTNNISDKSGFVSVSQSEHLMSFIKNCDDGLEPTFTCKIDPCFGGEGGWEGAGVFEDQPGML